MPRIVSQSLGGSALARTLIDGQALPAWYAARPVRAEDWRARAVDVRDSVPAEWMERLSLAFGASGAARDRLERVARGAGVVVTTGQQPGLFGGPIYTWSKAISALELADALERATGIPTAPVFWAATDDADFSEASDTWIARTGGAERLVMDGPAHEGLPMAEQPLGDVREALMRLAEAAGSTVDPAVLDAARLAYHPGATVGGAYLTLLRVLLQPLGIAVLDASHPALLDAERPLLARALTRGAVVAEALQGRASELRGQGHEPQVADVDGLTLVFGREAGRKVRVPLRLADEVAGRGAGERLSPNVLLRPVVERAVLPTVAYVAGPGEIGYFAQVSAVADALGAAVPLVVPRWSCTIIEPHIAARMAARGVAPAELADPHAVEGRLARGEAPAGVLEAVEAWRGELEGGADALRVALEEVPGLLPHAVVEGARRQMLWRAERLERRLVAALKRRDEAMRQDVATMRGALFPGGMRQERALNLLPLLARHGMGVFDAMRAGARRHADALLRGDPIPVDPA